MGQTSVEKRADSLFLLAHRAENDSLRFERLLELSYFWSDHDTAKAFLYMREARLLFPRPSPFQKGQLLFNEAGIIYDKDIPKAKELYKEADGYFSRYQSPRSFLYRSRLWNNYGALIQKQDSSEQHLDIIIGKSLPFARQSGSEEHIAANLVNIGLVLMNVTHYHKARHYFEEAIDALSRIPDAHEDRLTAFVNAARNEIYLRNFPASRRFLDSATTALSQIPHSAFAPYYYEVEGQYYRHMKEREKSQQFYKKGIAEAQKLNNLHSMNVLNFELYALYRDFGDYASAREMLRATSQNTGNPSDQMLILTEWANLEYHTGNYRRAYDSLKAAFALLDSLHRRELELKVLDLEKIYQTVEKENELLKLREEHLRQEQVVVRNRWLVYGLLVIICAMGAITYLIWRMNLQKKKLYEEEVRNLWHREHETQLRAILEGQERERNRIARDLHDGLGGMLAGVKLRLSSILSKMPHLPEDMDDVVTQLDQSSRELRRVARNMMPETLLSMGLAPALADLCKMMQTGQAKIKFQAIEMRKDYPDHISIPVYRIMQEMLANAVKHSGASNILVQGMEDNLRLYITVEDDGCGFEQEKAENKGLGLSNIRNRVSILGGEMEILTNPGEGTVFNIEIPLT